jgi:hypothetical protein
LITHEYIIYMRVYNFLDLQNEKYLQKSLVLSERLDNICNYSIRQRPSQLVEQKKGKEADANVKRTYEYP